MKISARKVTQFAATLDNVPGELARVTQALAVAGVNLEGFFQTVNSAETEGAIHFVTPSVDAARDALTSLGKTFSEKTILSLQYADKPGVIAHVTQALGNAKVNIEEMYLSTPGVTEETVLYVGVSEGELEKAQNTVESLS